jgi:hypothetical protein
VRLEHKETRRIGVRELGIFGVFTVVEGSYASSRKHGPKRMIIIRKWWGWIVDRYRFEIE